MNPIYIITGPPGAGTTTLSTELMRRYEYGIAIPVDDLRLWVASGLSDAIEWSDETARQFEVAEDAFCRIARCYWENGFAVAIDHCRNIPRLDKVIADYMPDLPVRRICLLPRLEINIERNRMRTNKDFDPELLEPIIRGMTDQFREKATEEWTLVDSGTLSPAEAADLIFSSELP